MKKCSKCKVEQPVENFHKGNNYCKPCKKEYDSAYKEIWNYEPYNKQKRYLYHLKKAYSLTLEALIDLYNLQAGGCAICNKELPNPSFEDAYKFGMAIDHDHSCCPTTQTCGNCIRGLLCRNCNLMVGHAKDNTETLKKAVEYINRTSRKVGNPIV